MHSKTVINCLSDLFTLCGIPICVHSDNARNFVSRDTSSHEALLLAFVLSTMQRGNSQVEKCNLVILRSVRLALKFQKLPIEGWVSVLPNVSYSLMSLFSNFLRISCSLSLLIWLIQPGTALLRNFVRKNKHDDLVREVNLTEANPCFARFNLLMVMRPRCL